MLLAALLVLQTAGAPDTVPAASPADTVPRDSAAPARRSGAAIDVTIRLGADGSTEPRDSTPRRASPERIADAYLDAEARALVERARSRRAGVERRIAAYDATARQRVYAGLRSLGRDRTLFRGETAARVHWRRDEPGSVEVLGAREASPAVAGGLHVPDDLAGEATDLAFDPDRIRLSFLSEEEGEGILDPLSPGAEADYRYRTDGRTTLRLPDGRTVRVRELEVLPRRREFRLARGSLWIDEETGAIARAVLTTARPFDLEVDEPDARDDMEDVPGIVRAGILPIRAEVRYVTVEYALYEGRWWLPRLISAEATARVGALGHFPVRFERLYSDVRVEALPEGEEVADAAFPADSATQAERCEGYHCACEDGLCRRWAVDVPADTAALLRSAELPEPLGGTGERLMTGEEVEELAGELVPSLGDAFALGVDARFDVASLRTVRYNRVEGLSVGARAEADAGAFAADAELRIGTGDWEPGAELGVSRDDGAALHRLGAYRRLDAFQGAERAFGPGASLSALLLGRDEADYLRATGVELTGRTLGVGRWTAEWRAFAETQRAVEKETDLSLVELWGESPFRPVIPADRADQLGFGFALGATGGTVDPSGWRWGASAGAEAQGGDFDFVRGRLRGWTGFPLPGIFAGALEAEAGSTAGGVPVQGLWYLGGPSTVRGYEGAALAGEAFWRARGEIGAGPPAVRLSLFSDAGWAGDRGEWELDPPLLSAGVGAGFLDGLVRLDLSRALRGDTGWRLDLHLGSTF